MSEEFKREQLDETLEELISGGQLQWANNGLNPGYRVWSDENPDQQYSVIGKAIYAMRELQKPELQGKSDAELISYLLQNGFITPM